MKNSLIAGFLITLITVAGLMYSSNNTPQDEADSYGPVSQDSSVEKPEQQAAAGASPQVESELEEEPESSETPEGNSVAVSDLEINKPSDDAFPVDSNHFSIKSQDDKTYEIELYAIINRPEQYQEYQEQLKQFKQEALAYMEDNNIDIGSVAITYIPEEAGAL